MLSSLTYAGFAKFLDTALHNGMDAVIAASLSAAVPVLRWLVVIFIIVSFAIVAAGQGTVRMLISRIVRCCFVVFFITGSGVYVTHVRDLAFDVIPSQIATVVTGSSTPITAADQFDQVSAKVDAITAMIFARNTSWTPASLANDLMAWFVSGGINFLAAVSFGVWMLGRVLMAIVLCYGPWLLVFELFERTRGWVDQWIGKIVGLSVFQLASAILMQIALSVEATILDNVHTTVTAQGGAIGGYIDQAIGTMVHVGGVFVVVVIAMVVLPSICAIGSAAASGQALATTMGLAAAGKSAVFAGRAGWAVGQVGGRALGRLRG